MSVAMVVTVTPFAPELTLAHYLDQDPVVQLGHLDHGSPSLHACWLRDSHGAVAPPTAAALSHGLWARLDLISVSSLAFQMLIDTSINDVRAGVLACWRGGGRCPGRGPSSSRATDPSPSRWPSHRQRNRAGSERRARRLPWICCHACCGHCGGTVRPAASRVC